MGATNNSFFNEFVKLYTKNLFLKSQLNKILNEKKKLSQIIIKLEQKRKKKNKEGKEVEIEINNNNINCENIIFYRKTKKIRRKKKDINYIYKCNFPNCNKSYPRKNFLNLHIRLKHKKDVYDKK